MANSASISNGSLEVAKEKESQGTSESSQPMVALDESMADLPPDGGLTAWLVVLASFLLYFNMLGITYCFGGFLYLFS